MLEGSEVRVAPSLQDSVLSAEIMNLIHLSILKSSRRGFKTPEGTSCQYNTIKLECMDTELVEQTTVPSNHGGWVHLGLH